jgi:hypothetical protein
VKYDCCSVLELRTILDELSDKHQVHINATNATLTISTSKTLQEKHAVGHIDLRARPPELIIYND